MDCEAVRVGALLRASNEASLPSEREHVTTYIARHPELFTNKVLQSDVDYSGVRLSVDEPSDLTLIRTVVGIGGPNLSYKDYAALVMNNANIIGINAHVARNEGRWRSENLDDLRSIGFTRGRRLSEEWHTRAERVIPGATQTLSKGPDQFVQGFSPIFLESGSGCHVRDVDGNLFIDYPMALGPIVLGYGHPSTVKAVSDRVALGTTFTLPHTLEVEVAERIVEVVPCAEMVRFGKNGSDATTAAVRLARAVTGRDIVIDCGYHGWHDWHITHTPRRAGIPELLSTLVDSFAWNDIDGLRQALARHDGNVAAVIIEVGLDDPKPGFLEQVKEEANRAGSVLIFDEIVTGFRYALGGAQEYFGVTPDLACFGKAMANGLPLSAVAGRADIMKGFERVFFSGTFGGELLSLAAAKATIDVMRTAPVFQHMWEHGEKLHAGLKTIITKSGLDVVVTGHPPRGALFFRRNGQTDPDLRGLFLQETVRRGILFGGPMFVTYAHELDDINRTLEVCSDVFEILVEAVETDSVTKRLEGLPPTVVFRPLQTSR
jgi:glutamate-1-semialdehyde 2,1-aminomutase/spore coat polysaccharide biosynthesis protein SpsF